MNEIHVSVIKIYKVVENVLPAQAGGVFHAPILALRKVLLYGFTT
jgi:hypothetical protein